MFDSLWPLITRFGNSALLLPAALAIALWLLASRAARLACAWAVCFGVAVALVFMSKVAFLGWGIGSRSLDFTGISGHSTVSTAVFTMLLWMLALHRGPGARRLAAAGGLGVGLLVSLSRWVLDAHSVSEVVAGFALGAGAALLALRWAPPMRQALSHRWVAPALVAALALSPVLGRPAEAHGLVVKLALLASGRTEPFSRDMPDW